MKPEKVFDNLNVMTKARQTTTPDWKSLANAISEFAIENYDEIQRDWFLDELQKNLR